MTSGCIFKNGAPTQVLRKVRILTKFGLCYTMREKVKIRKMQISFILIIFWPSYATFSMRRFLLTSVYINVRFSEVMDQMFLTVRGAVQGSFRATLGVASVFVHVVFRLTRLGSLETRPPPPPPPPHTHTPRGFSSVLI